MNSLKVLAILVCFSGLFPFNCAGYLYFNRRCVKKIFHYSITILLLIIPLQYAILFKEYLNYGLIDILKIYYIFGEVFFILFLVSRCV